MLKRIIKNNKYLKKISLWTIRNILVIFKNFNFLFFHRVIFFILDYVKFIRLGGKAKFFDLYPCLSDQSSTSTIDSHYFHQAI